MTIEHDADHRISTIMLEVQKAKEFPLQVKTSRGTVTLYGEREASLFSLAICITLESIADEEAWEQNKKG